MFDFHTHVVPAATPFLARLAEQDSRWARLVPGDEWGDVLVSGKVFRVVHRVAWDLSLRHERQLAAGVTGELLSAMPELFAPWAPATAAADYAQAFNDWLAAELPRHDGYFLGLGLVPAQDPATAAGMLPGIAAAGLTGVEIPAQPPGTGLHEPVWESFFAEAERLRLLVFVHAVGGPAAASFRHRSAANGVLFPNSIGSAIGSLLADGLLARHPGLQLLASHGGGSLITMLPRIEYFRTTVPDLATVLPAPVVEYARRLWFDPLLFDRALLQVLTDTVGPDRIVPGTDYPFMKNPLRYLDEVPEPLPSTIRTSNAAALLARVRPTS